VHFVPAHPVAATENSGPDSASPNCSSIAVHPYAAGDTDKAATERLAAFWRLLGANVESMPPDHHDLVLGITSHLPHLIAYTMSAPPMSCPK